MYDFNFNISTKILFGKDQLDNLADEIKKYGEKVLLVYGRNSIKKIGLYDKILKIFEDNSINHFELSGVVPNPRIDKVREGVKIAKENDVDFILAVGGGSVVDSAKLIAAGFYTESDPWEIVIKNEEVNNALPLGSILTLAATGSEMNAGSVITNEETGQKLGWGSEYVRPKFAIMNPEFTYSVDSYHTAAGTVDIMSHTMENYFTLNDGAYLDDRFAEAILKTCIKYGPIAINQGDNYEARANLMWANSWAINGLISAGKNIDWSVHPMEHELSALRDITHGVGLAILTPTWLEYCLDDETSEKIATFGYNVFDIEKSGSKINDAKKAIEALKEFFKSLGINLSLKEQGFKEDELEIMAKNCLSNKNKNQIDGFKPLKESDVLNIYKKAF
ncbi:iron-containing alcohol dehydrogenase [Anaerococcus sp. mt242]|mgnify:CR=1 FL=1|uniref:iron-containing alcohol dehydrogenase n=1 Tax=unclassified Anaerococcus TaxID=2614126 RepID=UPI00193364ED|nr:iron-containing alcohol dehydrogenase [Anaerococcus sp. mt242]MBM0045817.1 iron-containing alcohol dehydrogenase [Anaerococcus sp. mt242]